MQDLSFDADVVEFQRNDVVVVYSAKANITATF